MNRFAWRLSGQCFPTGRLRSMCRPASCSAVFWVGDGAGGGRSALAARDRRRLLRLLYDAFLVRLREDGLLPARSADADGREFPLQQPACVRGRTRKAWPWRGCCRMAGAIAVQVTMCRNEGEQRHRRTLHLELLGYLRKESVYAATAWHAAAGFWGGTKSRPRALGGRWRKAAGDRDLCRYRSEHVNRVAHRLIVRENVVPDEGSVE